ncbi:hypothetical protein U1872_06225 [Sphingomonas sp. RB3P16]|uniref:hypothetical protein n=1 Tax=Parasphingomonas frigoris TaxID=3096163 RepID=UPI002FCB8F79
MPIAEALPNHRHMAAFRTPLNPESWIIVGPGYVRDGTFHNSLGDWGALELVFALPPLPPITNPEKSTC